jgi:cephalosporin hydroxylase
MSLSPIVQRMVLDGGQAQVRKNGNLLWNGIKWPQRFTELQRFAELLAAENIRSYLEIGLQRGFTFRFVGRRLPPGSLMVGVDLGGLPDIQQSVAALKKYRHEVHLIAGDSTAPNIVAVVRALAPFDLVFIDGDHSLKAATADWENYGSLGRIVAFHDIDAEHFPRNRAVPVEVPTLWGELKQRHRHLEIVDERFPGAGIGVVWTG